MDIRGIVSFQINKENNSYIFQVPLGCPWTEAIAVLEEFIPALKEQQAIAAKAEAEAKAAAEAQAVQPVQEVSAEVVEKPSPAQSRPVSRSSISH